MAPTLHRRRSKLCRPCAQVQAPKADVDVLFVLADVDDYGSKVERTSALACELCLRHGPSMSQVFVRGRDWLQPFRRNVHGEVVAA